ncbi:MAG TPA: molybdate ABC transporter substrate-binding protein [Terrimicrobiaceae bacterium]|nr:molybdate ABC transporter substrate-binding protein [Terrimicrobiaceae bacterium]
MNRRHLIYLVTVVLLTTKLRAAELSVFAAASLTDALKEVAVAYESESGDKLVFNFAGSNALARQIKEGAPADVFFSADEIQMNHLAEASLIDPSTRVELLSNSLVIIVPEDGPAELTPAALGDGAIKRVALADPRSVPAGVYAREYLTKQGLWRAIEPKVVPTENVRAALAAVESGNVDAGMVYKTDAAISEAVKIAYEVPASDGPRISYPVAVLRETKHAEAAERFLTYLKSEPALAILKRFGFILP